MEKDLVFFDGVCNLCTSSVQWIIRNDNKDRFRFASLQSEYAINFIKDPEVLKTDSIVLYSRGKFSVKSTAVLKIASGLRLPAKMWSVFILIPAFLRNPIYDFIARNRYSWFGKKEVCWLPDEKLKSKFLG